MKEFFEQQLKYAYPLDSELLAELESKNYASGEEKKIGDILLFGFKAQYEQTEDNENLMLVLFSLCEREFPFYLENYTIIPSTFNQHMGLPIFIKKGEEDKYKLTQNQKLN